MLKILFIASLFLSLLGCDSQPTAPLKVAAHIWPGYEFMFLAQQEKWLDPQQVNLIQTHSATESLQALKEGKIDAAALTLDEVLRARADGIDLTVILIFNISAGADMLLAKPEFTTIQQLKGKRIGLEQGALGAIMLAKLLQQNNLTYDDIQQIPININQAYAAWQNNEVDALITYEPLASQLLANHAHKLFDSRDIPNTIIDVLAIRTKNINHHQPAIRHLIAQHFKAFNHFHNNIQDASYRMATHLQLAPEKVLTQYKGLLLANINYNKQLMQNPASSLLKNTRSLQTLMIKLGIIQTDKTINDDFFNASFLPAN